jgi:TonB-dependent receptor
VRTRRPFDFGGRELIASVRAVHGDLVHGTAPQYSGLASQRWDTGIGEVGALVNFSHQVRDFREDQKSVGNPLERADLIPGMSVTAPNGTSETSSAGQRVRDAGTVVLQWRPNARLLLEAEGDYAHFKTRQDSDQINVAASASFVPGSVRLFPGTSVVESISWTNAPISILSFARDTVDRDRLGALDATWSLDSLTVKADLSHADSVNTLLFSGPTMAGTAAAFSQDLSTPVPASSVSGTDLLQASNFRYASVAFRYRPFDGGLNAFRLDVEKNLDSPFLSRLAGGVRIANRGATDAPGLVFGDTPVTGIGASDRPQLVMPNPYSDFLSGAGATSLGSYLVNNLDSARDPVSLRNTLGITAPLPTAGSPLSVWEIDERTRSVYLMAERDGARAGPLGNVGLRLVQTRETLSGTRSDPTAGGYVPLTVQSDYLDVLPSANLRWRAAGSVVLRAAVSRSITRPNFDQLSPSLTLLPNTVNPALNQGSAGNPYLRPVRSSNLDLAAEWYMSPSSLLYATGFYKRVDGFVGTVASPEVYDGASYEVSRPRNMNVAHIKGVEGGYQQFFDFLPGWLRGTGIQANATVVDSATHDALLGDNVPLQSLSRYSANVIAMYELGGVSARLAYNWRDRFLSGVVNVVGVGALPVYTDAYSWLDASLRYRLARGVSLSLEGTNLLRTMRRAYYGGLNVPQSVWLDDRQIGALLSVAL